MSLLTHASPEQHVYVYVCTDGNRLVQKCACGEPAPVGGVVPAAAKPRNRSVRATPKLAAKDPSIYHVPLLAGKCNAADPISPLRCTRAPGHTPGRHSWITA